MEEMRGEWENASGMTQKLRFKLDFIDNRCERAWFWVRHKTFESRFPSASANERRAQAGNVPPSSRDSSLHKSVQRSVRSASEHFGSEMAALFTLLFTVILHQVSCQYAIKRIDNSPDCPSIYCGWNCARFIDSRGCVFCGPCHPVTERCPRNPTCPSDNFNVCEMRQGPDGCWTCICKTRPRRPTYPRPSYKTKTNQAPNPESSTQQQQQPQVEWQLAPGHIRKTPVCKGPVPMCSANCVVYTKADGCDACFCTKKRNCTPEVCKLDCRPEIGADGCPHCTCPNSEVAACKEVICDSDNCTHVVDRRTGCAVACECNKYQIEP